MLAEAVTEADRMVRSLAEDDHQPITTLTAMLWSGSLAALVHIGDGRAYRLRGRELSQLTQHRTYVQSLVGSGKLTAEEAASHPERALLVPGPGRGRRKGRGGPGALRRPVKACSPRLWIYVQALGRTAAYEQYESCQEGLAG
jgi:serine/threonine protein phosphatase PrpC